MLLSICSSSLDSTTTFSKRPSQNFQSGRDERSRSHEDRARTLDLAHPGLHGKKRHRFFEARVSEK